MTADLGQTGDPSKLTPAAESVVPLAHQSGIAEVRAALVDAADALAEADCVFWACPGADAPFEDMRTCRVCAAAQAVRAKIERLDAAVAG